MPQRLLRPGLKDSPKWNAVDWMAQSLYVRLLNVVDDYGRYYADPRILLGHCFAMRQDVDLTAIVSMCQQLSDNKLAVFYNVEGERYIQLLKWQERVRAKSKFPDVSADICCQLSASCCHLIASPPSPPSPPSPSPTPLALEIVEVKHHANGDSEWLQVLQASEAYKELDVSKQYSKAGIWCKQNRRRLTRRFFLGWLNRQDRQMTEVVVSEPNGKISGAEMVVKADELRRVETKMQAIRCQYGDHQSWTKEDRDEFNRLKAIRDENRKLLGVRA